ncbi:MAG: hypothetical protein NC094_00825 [Bacteroidales bacterium]|nr:hypothetical protein [Lachnoclostridium sp.]MCM1463937.1 hypothetical protein [Bacteroidales bacterium]
MDIYDSSIFYEHAGQMMPWCHPWQILQMYILQYSFYRSILPVIEKQTPEGACFLT